ncbi:hypothetical protein CkaCkLH20_02978 [Colletotrichum karsti]|uniref:LamG-like jellyroll fold domain-containing protein n=1 Tax=Colletotrichum karsti TaxID=1095194 RepID=A0A9P6LND3_9PEZI|nr:uncharacterized protein CkaCkLH20_02978 [Colletotrichum karsti]KAF9879435.1 hypothetical protein CkaCkLH20_02978 [Colletotrichum karsti]
MTLHDILSPNRKIYESRTASSYLSSRLITHNGVTVAIALGRREDRSLFFDYSVLDMNAADADPASKAKNKADLSDQLDSQCWLEQAKPLSFPSEVRVASEEAVPVYEIPGVDRTNSRVSVDQPEKRCPWKSTTVNLMDRDVTHFEVLSNGRYIYLFRQGQAASSAWANSFMTADGDGVPPVDGNLLCDRFSLVGTNLSPALEARYRRSRQKRIPLNDQDTLGIRDINDKTFYEPTYSLKFIRNLVGGRFCVLRAPTMTNDIYRWMFFAYSSCSRQIEYTSTDVTSDGLFDLHGQVYYTCDKTHLPTFTNAPGSCVALTEAGTVCGKPKIPIVPKCPKSTRSLQTASDVSLRLQQPINFSDAKFEAGFTLEAWIRPKAFWDPNAGQSSTKNDSAKKDEVKKDEGKKDEGKKATEPSISLPPSGSLFCIFSPSQGSGMAVYLNDKLKLVLSQSGSSEVLATSDAALKANAWNHVAITYRGTDSRNYTLVVDGETAETSGTQKPSDMYTLPQSSLPGTLAGLDSEEGKPGSSFIGAIDEVRLWSQPFHPGTIRSRMHTRATGIEPFLEACWHFDEGAGGLVFDCTSKNHTINVTQADGSEPRPNLWEAAAAPLIEGRGLTRRQFRLPTGVTVCGGIGTTIYNEQVTMSEAKPEDPETKPKAEPPKQMKRGARVLLCFVAKTSERQQRLAVLDFGLLSNGLLCDTPVSLPLPVIRLSPSARASTELVYVDAQGVEVFGGLLLEDKVRCSSEAPCAFESATGTVTVFFQSEDKLFSALYYDISRSVVVASTSALVGHDGLLARSKLRKAKTLTIKTDISSNAPKSLAINLILTANMADGSKVVETWKNVPSQFSKLLPLINGTRLKDNKNKTSLGTAEANSLAQDTRSTFLDISCCIIKLVQPLEISIPAGSRIMIEASRRYLVLRDGKLGDVTLTASPYMAPTLETKLESLVVCILEYDFDVSVSCQGKAAGDFASGSTLVELIPGADTSQLDGCFEAPVESSITGDGKSPYFSSSPGSTALKLGGDDVLTMLSNPSKTAPCSGMTFESWIKVEEAARNSIAIAYKSTHLPRTEGGPEEHQKLVLGVPAVTDQLTLVGNINGCKFSLSPHAELEWDTWAHMACSVRHTFALKLTGTEYVDLGDAQEFNVSDFTLAFTLKLDKIGPEEQILFSKADSATDKKTPLCLKVTSEGRLRLEYLAEDENGGTWSETSFESRSGTLQAGVAYKIFVSRKLDYANKPDPSSKKVTNTPSVSKSNESKGKATDSSEYKALRPCQLVTMRVWDADGGLPIKETPRTVAEITKTVNGWEGKIPFLDLNPEIHGQAQSNDSPLYFGGAPWAGGKGLCGSIGSILLYSAATAVADVATSLCSTSASERSLLGWWSFRNVSGSSIVDELGRNHGKLKGQAAWVPSPFEADNQLRIFVNGVPVDVNRSGQVPDLLKDEPVGTHQLTLGNIMLGDDTTRYLGEANNFRGKLDELRIWSTPRTRENICDSMHTRLPNVPSDMAVYLSFDNQDSVIRLPGVSESGESAILIDDSINCWHLTALHGGSPKKVPSSAPIGYDAPCVTHVLSSAVQAHGGEPLLIKSRPSVSEYGDMQIGASGSMEGSYKRAYTYINEGDWSLVTGFRLGSLLTEWVSQVQTAPTLIGYIEGAPPLPADSFTDPNKSPSTSVRFSQAKRCTYSYSSGSDSGQGVETTATYGGGLEWKVSVGVGVQTSAGKAETDDSLKRSINISNSNVRNEVSTSTTNANMEMRVELTGAWDTDPKQPSSKIFAAANTGLALVESEVADVFALRLQTRAPMAPLVAYQIRPNPDIPKDRNLVSFELNKMYTKQGCLDGRRGLGNDVDYPSTSTSAPKDASYFKPAEAYALKDRIRRAEEQRDGEYERYNLEYTDLIKHNLFGRSLPRRVSRSICNSYVWTADGGTYQETNSTLDMVRSEVGVSLDALKSDGVELSEKITAGVAMQYGGLDAMASLHYNFNMTKDKEAEEGFELKADLPPAVDLRVRDENTKIVSKTPGAVDCYRWMSFWLEPSVEATDVFFKQVLNPVWLEGSPEPNAALLRSLRENLSTKTGDTRTKAWRVLHRCTYLSRVPEPIKSRPAETAPAEEAPKKSSMLADLSCNWMTEFYHSSSAFVNGQIVYNLFSQTNREKHKKLRQPIEKYYSPSSVVSLERNIDNVIEMLCRQLETRFMEGPNSEEAVVDLDAWDLIGSVTFSQPFGYLDTGYDFDNTLANAEKALDYFVTVGAAPFLDRLLDKNPLFRIGPPGFNNITGVTVGHFHERLEGAHGDLYDPNHPDFLDKFLEAQKSDPEGVDDVQIISWLMVNMVAGADTTAIAIRSSLYFSLKDPRVWRRLTDEVLQRNFDITPPAYKDAIALPYLDAVVREALRVLPGVSMTMERYVPSGGITLPSGDYVPEGYVVGMNPYITNRIPAVYGQDADEFRPERWLRDEQAGETEEEYGVRLKIMKAYDLTFGGGRRSCIGKHMALTQVYKVLPTLISRYEIELVDKDANWKVTNSWFPRQEGLRVNIRRRL